MELANRLCNDRLVSLLEGGYDLRGLSSSVGCPCRTADARMTMAENPDDDIKAMSFEQALEALEKIVDDLERGDVPLDQSIRIYERGEALKAHCDRAAEVGRGQGGEDPPVARRQARRHGAAGRRVGASPETRT
jgi:exodeoxyribonuclease VII small subunit